MQIDKLGLQIGCPIQLQLLDDKKKTYTVQLIGLTANQGLIISAPKSAGSELSMILRDDQPLNISIHSFKYVITFRSKIVEKRLTPFPHIHISVPVNIETSAKPHDAMISLQQSVTIINDDAKTSVSHAELTAISYREAMLVHADHLGKKGQRITATMSFSFAGKNNVIVLEGLITEVVLDPVHQRNTSTITYNEMDQEDKILLYAFIYELMLIDMNIVNK